MTEEQAAQQAADMMSCGVPYAWPVQLDDGSWTVQAVA